MLSLIFTVVSVAVAAVAADAGVGVDVAACRFVMTGHTGSAAQRRKHWPTVLPTNDADVD